MVAQSRAEAEFRSMALGICELLWLKILLTDLNVQWTAPMCLYCDRELALTSELMGEGWLALTGGLMLIFHTR